MFVPRVCRRREGMKLKAEEEEEQDEKRERKRYRKSIRKKIYRGTLR